MPEQRPAAVDPLADQRGRARARRSAPSRARTRRRRAGRAPSAGRGDLVIVGDHGLGADPLERLLDRPQVPHAVIEDADPAHVSVPFVDGTPLSSGSIDDRHAQRSRERLEAWPRSGGGRWCRSGCRRAAVSFAFVATARKNSSASSESKPAIETAGSSDSKAAERAPGDVDRAFAQRLVHRHDRVAVAADPGAVAERLVERQPERDPDVLDRVVGAGLEVAGRLDHEADPGVATEQLEHVVEEADPGRRPTPRRRRASSSSVIWVSRVLRSILAVRGSAEPGCC